MLCCWWQEPEWGEEVAVVHSGCTWDEEVGRRDETGWVKVGVRLVHLLVMETRAVLPAWTRTSWTNYFRIFSWTFTVNEVKSRKFDLILKCCAVQIYSPGPQPGSLSSENISLVPIASNLNNRIRARNEIRASKLRWGPESRSQRKYQSEGGNTQIIFPPFSRFICCKLKRCLESLQSFV